ncbi:hypothetical protein N2W54_001411 [Lotmaria passim]
MDERARQFKIAAESQLTGSALKKEINTLRRFLFRNQEYRFTKAAQQALYMAVMAHHGNPAAHHASGLLTAETPAKSGTSGLPSSATTATATASPAPGSTVMKAGERLSDNDGDDDGQGDAAAAEAPILRLLDDALKMPFTVFTSPQKDKLLSLYWAVLGTEGSSGGTRGAGAATTAALLTQRLSLMDIVDVGPNKATLSLFTDDGDEYAQEVVVDDAATLQQLRKEFDEGNAVLVKIQETDTGARFLSFVVEDE